jgi:hypothetical protein
MSRRSLVAGPTSARSAPMKFASTNAEVTRLHPPLLVDKNAQFVCSVREPIVRVMQMSNAAIAFLFDPLQLAGLELFWLVNAIENQYKLSDMSIATRS